MIQITGSLALSLEYKFLGGKTMTYITCKKVIENQMKKGTLDVGSMTAKLDVFLLADRISEEEYNELLKMMEV